MENRAVQFSRLDLQLRLDVELHAYPREALDVCVKADGRGSVCLPTGSGKTIVALKAIEHVGESTLVVLPTIDLMNQWYALLTDAFGIEVGILGGGYHEVREVTVTTYDSAYLLIDRYGNRFALLVFDEVHQLPSATYALIPEVSLAPYRLGLTATYERPDGLHGKLDRLIGPKVYERTIKDLRGERLAEYEVVRFGVDLTPEELVRYRENQKTYTSYLREKGLRFYGPNAEAFLRESAYDPKARKALVAMHEARRIIHSPHESRRTQADS